MLIRPSDWVAYASIVREASGLPTLPVLVQTSLAPCPLLWFATAVVVAVVVAIAAVVERDRVLLAGTAIGFAIVLLPSNAWHHWLSFALAPLLLLGDGSPWARRALLLFVVVSFLPIGTLSSAVALITLLAMLVASARNLRDAWPLVRPRPVGILGAAMTHVFVAPHPDDVALSCGGLIASLRELGQNVAILTLYSGSGRVGRPERLPARGAGLRVQGIWPVTEAFNRAHLEADYPVDDPAATRRGRRRRARSTRRSPRPTPPPSGSGSAPRGTGARPSTTSRSRASRSSTTSPPRARSSRPSAPRPPTPAT